LRAAWRSRPQAFGRFSGADRDVLERNRPSITVDVDQSAFPPSFDAAQPHLEAVEISERSEGGDHQRPSLRSWLGHRRGGCSANCRIQAGTPSPGNAGPTNSGAIEYRLTLQPLKRPCGSRTCRSFPCCAPPLADPREIAPFIQDTARSRESGRHRLAHLTGLRQKDERPMQAAVRRRCAPDGVRCHARAASVTSVEGRERDEGADALHRREK